MTLLDKKQSYFLKFFSVKIKKRNYGTCIEIRKLQILSAGMNSGKKKRGQDMKSFLGKCCMYALILALVAGVFGYWMNAKSEDHNENGVLVKNICKEGNV